MTTNNEDKLIAKEPIIGLSSSPKLLYNKPAANGIHIALTAFAKGCSDDFSKEYAIFKKSCSLISLIISVTFGFPFVIVPVLSKITYFTSPKVCSASYDWNKIICNFIC